jgi:hypothetical protein
MPKVRHRSWYLLDPVIKRMTLGNGFDMFRFWYLLVPVILSKLWEASQVGNLPGTVPTFMYLVWAPMMKMLL